MIRKVMLIYSYFKNYVAHWPVAPLWICYCVVVTVISVYMSNVIILIMIDQY